jgi:transposase
MNFIKGSNRCEVELFPACLDDYIDMSSSVRELDVFVESLDLAECGFIFPKSDTRGRGRPSYHPKVLLKLYIYGYLNSIRSGRKLEKACHLNIELMWLVQKLRPDFKTICDFRKKNSASFKRVAAEYTLDCYRRGYIAGDLLSVDGSRIKGLNSKDKSWNLRKTQRLLSQLEKETSKYLKILEEADKCPIESDNALRENLEDKMAKIEERKEKIKTIQSDLENSEGKSLSCSDPDSRLMRKNGKTIVGYNVQTVVDDKHCLIVSSEVTNKMNDIGLLTPMSTDAKELLNLEQTEVLADKGYYSSNDLKGCEDNNITPYVPEVKSSPSERKGLFGKRHFIYNSSKDLYTCPAKHELKPSQVSDSNEKNYRNRTACQNCPLKPRCTHSKYRSIKRNKINDPVLERNRQRIKEQPEKLKRRKAIVEHPYSCLKNEILTGGFVVRGFSMVRAEFCLAQIAYNMKRVFKIKSEALRRKKRLSRPIIALSVLY